MSIRKAAVAGMFYPDNPSELKHTLEALLMGINTPVEKTSMAAIVPHAGYVYSGSTAAKVFGQLNLSQFDCLLLLGPAHRVALTGMAIPTNVAFETPLGCYPLAVERIESINAAGLAKYDDVAHQFEHSLEVQIPFLQCLGISTPLLPVVVGNETPQRVLELIEHVTSQCHAFVMVSSDLSHFHPHEQARLIDNNTSKHILMLDANIQPEEACGCMAMNGFLLWLQQHGHQIQLLDQCTSGDTAGDKNRVVGYGAYIVYQ